jgi:hypothetical protein
MGPILDIVVISRDVAGVLCKELGWHVNMCLLRSFTMLVRAHHFASSVVTLRGYKAGGHPYANLCPPTRPPITSSPPSLRLKRKERHKDRSRKQGRELLGLQGVASPSLLGHGGAGLDPVRGHNGAPTRVSVGLVILAGHRCCHGHVIPRSEK